MDNEFPILEFDDSSPAIIEPSRTIAPIEISEYCVICFFQEVIDKLVQDGVTTLVKELKSEIGLHPVYEFIHSNRKVALFHPGIGAPFAAGMLEEVIALGCRKFIVCGGAGVLQSDTPVGSIFIPISAIRDEGTSYHYLPPSREVGPSSSAIEAIKSALSERKLTYELGKTWTTDAFFRETQAKIQKRKAEGCRMVEMEAAAFFAVAQFRKVTLGQILMGGDDVSGSDWDKREKYSRLNHRESIFWLAVESCLLL
jgi:uridine phosphorylase